MKSLLKSLDKTEQFKKGKKINKDELLLWQIPETSGKILSLLINLKKPKTILELGTGSGYSTLWLHTKNSEIYTIERDPRKIQIAKKFLKKFKNITLLEGEIKEILKTWNKKIDFLFIDADKRNYLNYLKTLEPFLNKEAIIVADNTTSHKDKLKDYITYTKKHYKSFQLDIDNGLMISIKDHHEDLSLLSKYLYNHIAEDIPITACTANKP